MSGEHLPATVGASAGASVLDPECGPVDPRLLAWLEARYGALRGLMARTAADLVAIGRILAEVKAELAHSEFLAFLAAVGISRSTAYRWMEAAAAAADCSHVENVEPSALYALAAKSTPEEVREAFFDRAAAGQRVTVQAVRETLKEHRRPRPTPPPNHAERMVDAIVAAEEVGTGRGWFGRDARADRIAEEIGRFREEAQAEVAQAVDTWGRACVEAAAAYLDDGSAG